MESKELVKVDENKLKELVKESELDSTKAAVLLENFQDYFKMASEWEVKARAIVVTDASQQADMQMARVGRLFLREKRIAIEKTRKELKEQALREGKAIDGIANVLKALIVPIEEYLDRQEHYVEIKAKEEAARLQAEAEAKAEAERLAAEEAEKRERERIRLENEKLKKEAEKRERERIKREKEIEAEKLKVEAEKREAEEKARKEREASEAKARAEREAAEKAIQKEREKAERQRQALLEKQREAERKAKEAQAQMERERQEREKAEAERRAREVECPFCHKRFVPADKEPELF